MELDDAIERMRKAKERFIKSRDPSVDMAILRGWTSKEHGYISPHDGRSYTRYGMTNYEMEMDQAELLASVDAVLAAIGAKVVE